MMVADDERERDAQQQEQQDTAACRQYIWDRVKGQSFVPQDYRKGGVKEGQHYVNDNGEDLMDWTNRPPHFLCFVPPIVAYFPNWLEQNGLCICMGKIGLHEYFKTKHLTRRRLFIVGFCCNFAALAFVIFASLANTYNSTLLDRASFSRAHGFLLEHPDEHVISLNLGVRAIYFEDHRNLFGGSRVYITDDYCEAAASEDEQQYVPYPFRDSLEDGLCGKCKDSPRFFILSCIFNGLMIFKNMFSDITRMYPRYDLNCPSFAGSVFATLSVGIGFYTIFIYEFRCYNNVQAKIRAVLLFWGGNATDFSVAEGDEWVSTRQSGPTVDITMEWWRGPGLTAWFVATIFRMVDAFCNYIVPTPGIARKVEEQKFYEWEFGDAKLDEKDDILVDD